MFISGFGVEEADALIKSVTEKIRGSSQVPTKTRGDVENKCKQIQATLEEIDRDQLMLKTRYGMLPTKICKALARNLNSVHDNI